MKKYKSVICVCMIAVMLLLPGCSGSKGYPEKRNENWVKDIDNLQDKLSESHYNLYANVTEAEFNAQMEKLKQDIPNINDDEIQIRLMEIFAPIGDSHLIAINFFTDVMKPFSSEAFFGLSLSCNMKEMLPLKTMWFGEDLTVVEADSQYKELLGAKLNTIGGSPVNTVMDKINGILPYSNLQRKKYLNVMMLCHPQILRHFNLLDKDKISIELTLLDGNKVTKDIKLKPTDSISFVKVTDALAEKPLVESKDDIYWYEYLPEDKAIYFRLKTYGYTYIPDKVTYGQDRVKNERDKRYDEFDSFLDGMMKTIDEKKPEKIVIDLRGNNGGIIKTLDPFRNYISKNENIPKEGCVFILEDRGSFSASILEATEYKEKNKALVVGEPAGERPIYYDGGSGAGIITLPNSKLSILYCINEFKAVDEKVDSLMPDIPVEWTFEDYQKGVDPYLKAALDYK